MSTYNLEPATKGAVILETTHGPLHIKLWSNEAPTTTKNFLQHCLNGYYNDLAFHRIIPDVLIQTGDPTKTGTGGVAAIGEPGGFKPELCPRLRFRRRGMVGMVCDGGVCRSQFFVTLGKTEWLDGEHCVFGEIVGNSVYNLVSIGERAVDGFDGSARIKTVRIVENPFPELVPVKRVERDRGKVVVNAKVAVRKRNLLSFAESDDDDEDEVCLKKGEQKVEVRNHHDDQRDRDDDVVVEDKKEDDDEIIRKANEEFESLKAQLDQAGEERVEPGVTRQKRRGRDESLTLRRLKAFETRIRKSRKEAKKDECGRIVGDWFQRGLQLGTSILEEDQYQVHFGHFRK